MQFSAPLKSAEIELGSNEQMNLSSCSPKTASTRKINYFQNNNNDATKKTG